MHAAVSWWASISESNLHKVDSWILCDVDEHRHDMMVLLNASVIVCNRPSCVEQKHLSLPSRLNAQSSYFKYLLMCEKCSLLSPDSVFLWKAFVIPSCCHNGAQRQRQLHSRGMYANLMCSSAVVRGGLSDWILQQGQ